MKTVEVVAAVIERDGSVLATQRGYGEFKGRWEFPGGKIEPGESPEEALTREIREELKAEVAVGRLVYTVDYDYPSFHLHMLCFLCHLVGGYALLEHEAARWLDAATIGSVDWLPADFGLIRSLKAQGIVREGVTSMRPCRRRFGLRGHRG
ncbi:(deoxy)nucleoside triphosphate pyrophosphohydrolase [Curtanaerobium respiraculi]|uniref:(deoxy)nucleoside triphosphate pyrophosphohydrolase n=1 Tax=Curtanaerobium respiraculi TaxID=2949669 RepID=UPI0024B34BD7|nr:(deoxy)nucleoside triphosphate pyrophosphohydrolase [Curtanaerobium respiraculi]